MDNLYNNIKELCDFKGIKPGKMCVDTGISKGLVTDLKMGRKKTIQIETAKKIADYFGVTVDRVMGVETEKAAPVSESGVDAANNWLKEADIKKILGQMTPNELAELMGKVALELKGRGLE